MSKIPYLLAAFLFSLQLLVAQNSTLKIDMLPSNWDAPKEATFEQFDNRATLLINGKATVKNQEFTNGTIEVDVYANSNRSFAGIIFRKQHHSMEEVYMRLHKSNQVDAVQYTPIFNKETNWQLYREYQAKVSFKNKGWNTLRIEVNNRKAEVFVNDEKVMTVDNLRITPNAGAIGITSLFDNRFSNFRITHREAADNSEIVDIKPLDPSIISQWEITQAKPYKGNELVFDDFSKEEYISVTTEKSGLLPFSKYLQKSSSGNFENNEENYTIASTTIHAKKKETSLFSFDYSDKIIVYLNGNAIFKGNNAFRAKGIQYMGHLDINANTLYLPLQKGVNTIHCVVIDKANGWGIMAKLN